MVGVIVGGVNTQIPGIGYQALADQEISVGWLLIAWQLHSPKGCRSAAVQIQLFSFKGIDCSAFKKLSISLNKQPLPQHCNTEQGTLIFSQGFI